MRWFSALLLALYTVFVVRLTLADPSSSRPVFSATSYWAELISGGRLDATQIEVLANVALFVPAGLLLAIVLQRPVAALALCVLASIGIELAQLSWFPTRVPSVADVEHNSLGAALGVLTFWLVAQGSRWLTGGSSSTEQPA